MPNPLIGSVRLNTGKRADERPHAIPPDPETHRYLEFADDGTPEDMSASEMFYTGADNTSGVYEVAPEPVEPIPVIVMQGFTRELRKWRTGQEILDSTTAMVVRMIAGRNPARRNISIKNTGAQTMYVGETESVAAYTGYPIAAGVEKIFNHEDAIFAVAVAGQATTVAILEEFTVREQ